MRSFLRPAAILALCFGSIVLISSNRANGELPEKPIKTSPKIQVAILLDVSGSMDGLIEQAKAQLWNMVSVMGKATCDNVNPQIEIALYEYGRSTNDVKQGYVKQINGFSTDLDQLSKNLFALNTNGGDEYCGHVMLTSLNDLGWDTSSASYKVIFIAGNEDFLQGSVSWTKACEEARKKGVIVNTIYCGDKMQGIKEHWNLAGECGMGSYTNINHGAKIEDIPTPYDSALFTLNHQLNNTYIAYGYEGNEALAKQQEVDAMNYSMNKSVAAKRVAVKGNKGLYRNSSWDLVDAYDTDSTFIAKVDMKTLPLALQNKSRAELEKIVREKNVERATIQKEIEKVNNQRESFIATERVKKVSVDATLESEVEKIIKVQARRFNMVIQ
ncbi:MAG TPA: hypothetical protein VGC29_07135 [Flavisolibacter sp.]